MYPGCAVGAEGRRAHGFHCCRLRPGLEGIKCTELRNVSFGDAVALQKAGTMYTFRADRAEPYARGKTDPYSASLFAVVDSARTRVKHWLDKLFEEIYILERFFVVLLSHYLTCVINFSNKSNSIKKKVFLLIRSENNFSARFDLFLAYTDSMGELFPVVF